MGWGGERRESRRFTMSVSDVVAATYVGTAAIQVEIPFCLLLSRMTVLAHLVQLIVEGPQSPWITVNRWEKWVVESLFSSPCRLSPPNRRL